MIHATRLVTAAALLWPASTVLAADPVSPPAAPRSVALDDIAAIKTPGDPHFSPDGKLVAYAIDDRIHVVPADRGATRAVSSAGSKAWDPRWSRDGHSTWPERAGRRGG